MMFVVDIDGTRILAQTLPPFASDRRLVMGSTNAGLAQLAPKEQLGDAIRELAEHFHLSYHNVASISIHLLCAVN